MLTVLVAGEELVLLADRAIWYEAERALLVADVHLGKAAGFRTLGVPVPGGTTARSLDRLSQLVEDHRPAQLVVLGDLFHARHGLTPSVRAAWLGFLAMHPEVRVRLIEGNHDLRSGRDQLGRAEPEREGSRLGPFELRHHPIEGEGYVLAGHLHPAVRLEGLSLPCFWFGARVGMLPAFGEFTGTSLIRPVSGDLVALVAERRVYALEWCDSASSR